MDAEIVNRKMFNCKLDGTGCETLSLTLREEQRLRVLEREKKKILRR
jgi:hypothetical protein